MKKSCNFCGQLEDKDLLVVSIGNHQICHICFNTAHTDLINSDKFKSINSETSLDFNLKPKEIKAKLDQYVIGQEEAKKILSVATFNHYKRISTPNEIEKSNVIITGTTGTGKTLLAKTIAKIVDVPFVSVDATTFSATGYAGANVESIISNLYKESGESKINTEMGIVFIDEIDKIKSNIGSNMFGKDVSGVCVQQSLLKILEGTEVFINEKTKIDTKNILFICGGAFDGISKIIEADKENLLSLKDNITHNHLHEYGLTPEFLGRLPILVNLESLTPEILKRIITEPKNSILEQYTSLFKLSDIDLKIEDKAISKIVSLCLSSKLGARSLRSIFERSLNTFMFECDSPNLRIKEENIF